MPHKPEIVITFPGGKRVDANMGGRFIRTDQSKLAGGDASAPEPFALFLASIGTCAGIYVLGFLQSRGLETEGVQIKQRLEFDSTTGGLGGVELEIEVPDTIPEKYHAALVRAADMCAVKKAIQNSPEFAVHVTRSENRETSSPRWAAIA
jgi:ribosomal protein S12 methylthiotransferase accessory factor